MLWSPAILALSLVFVMFKSILGSFEQQASNQYAVPSVIGMTLEEAVQLLQAVWKETE